MDEQKLLVAFRLCDTLLWPLYMHIYHVLINVPEPIGFASMEKKLHILGQLQNVLGKFNKHRCTIFLANQVKANQKSGEFMVQTFCYGKNLGRSVYPIFAWRIDNLRANEIPVLLLKLGQCLGINSQVIFFRVLGTIQIV